MFPEDVGSVSTSRSCAGLFGQRLDALGPAPRAELLHVLTLPDCDRADRIGKFYGNVKTRTLPSS
jgi:hypothetical protein